MRWLVQMFRARITIFNARSRWSMHILFAVILLFVCLGFSALSDRFAACVFGQPLHPVGIWIGTVVVVPGFVWFLFRLFKDWLSVFRNRKS